jgi:dipeptidyl aminopeptidase/acylaminoacyl peptidase
MVTPSRPWALLVFTLLYAAPAAAQTAEAPAPQTYKVPPPHILEIMDAPAAPSARISPNQKWLVITERDPDHTPLAELAEPQLAVAGVRRKLHPDTRIDNLGIKRVTLRTLDGATERILQPPAGARISGWETVRDSATGGELAYTLVHRGAMTVRLYDATTGIDRPVSTPGLRGKIGGLTFTRDGKHLAFSATVRDGVTLWIVDTRRATGRAVRGIKINHINGGFAWTRGLPPLVVRAVVNGRGAPPLASEVPTGPIVQESFGRTAAGSTFQNLSKSPHDEALFEYHYANQIALVDVAGKVTPLGAPGLHQGAATSPDGRYLLVDTLHRPFSYQVPMSRFPRRTEVWDRAGKLVKLINDAPLREHLPSARDATTPGIRGISWRGDVPATLQLVEALDEGDPRKKVAKRDRVSLWTAPFTGERVTFFETELRFAGVTWTFPEVALVHESSERTAKTRTWVVNPANPTAAPRLLWDRNSEDRYSHPGSLVYTEHPTEYRQWPLRSPDGRWVYLQGAGAAPPGGRPFLDRLDLATLKTERLWQSAPPHYENLLEVLDPEAARIVVTRESPTLRPNLFLRALGAAGETPPKQLTDLPDPAPWFAKVKGEQIKYKRADGTQLHATLYLPPDYDRTRDGPLPFVLWAYPREFLTSDGANQITGSPLQFRRPARSDHLLLLAHGYGVLDNPTMPIVGKPGKEPNDEYVPQLVASARAAVDEVVRLGVADRHRVAISGHSYGAFMAANLLAHTDLFRAGIARSGAYNRTLTPFGFQAEPRTYWEAPDIYHAMSPFTHVRKIKEPLLLIHGMRDSNGGTFPVQTERLFAALKGSGGNTRYVQLPLEDHGYAARESRRHVIWEMITWLDEHVRNARPAAQTAAAAAATP